MAGTIVLIIFTALCIIMSIWYLANKYHKNPKQHNCYLIGPNHESPNMINDSNYIIEKIGYFVGEGSKQGLKSVDIRVDLRHTQVSSVYKAIGVIQSQDGITISEKEKGPSTLLLSVEWVELHNITA